MGAGRRRAARGRGRAASSGGGDVTETLLLLLFFPTHPFAALSDFPPKFTHFPTFSQAPETSLPQVTTPQAPLPPPL